MGGCEVVRGGVCVCDRTYPALHPDAGRPPDHPAEDRRGVDGIAASMTLFLLYLGFKLRGLTGMILAVPVGLVFINFYKYGAFDSMIRNSQDADGGDSEIPEGRIGRFPYYIVKFSL